MQGQINLNSAFGKKINEICFLEKNKVFVEIGTWNGQGTTHCVMDALLKREDKTEFVSLECSYDRFLEATSLWKKILIPDHMEKSDILKIIHGRIVELQEIYKKEELHTLPGFYQDWYNWYDEDYRNLEKCPNVSSEVPEEVDVLILDGGEFSTFAEFNKIFDRVKNYIVLDDCNILKTNKINKFLKSHEDWEVFVEDLNDRNGYAIFKKKEKVNV